MDVSRARAGRSAPVGPRCSRSRVRRGLVLLGLLGAACQRGSAPVPDAGAPAEPSRREGTSATGVYVPVPAGWRYFPAESDVVLAGPRTGPVLRLDRQARAAAELPSPAALQEGLGTSLHTARLENVKEETGEGLSLVFFDLTATGADGGEARTEPGMVGAKVVGRDLFLCASLPGASAADVRAGAGVCRELTPRSAQELPPR